MDPDKSRALDLLSEFVKGGMGINFGLEARHLKRDVSINRKSETVFLISVDRHPHLFGRGSLGKMSSAYADVIQTFSVDIRANKVNHEREKVENFEINYYALAEEDFDIEPGDWWLDNDNRERLANIESEDKVRIFAEKLFPSLDLKSTNKVLYISDYELPSNFMDKLLEAQTEKFIDKVVEVWIWINNPDYED